MTTDDLKQQFIAARKFGVPLLAIETPDMAATISLCIAALNGGNSPCYAWDIVTGLTALNKPATAKIGADLNNPVDMLQFAKGLDKGACVFIMNAHRFWENEATVQAVWNLRDPFKESGRTLVLLAPVAHLPIELERDVLVLDEPLPDDQQLGDIASKLYDQIGLTKKFPADQKQETIRASRGLSAFGAEQAIAMSLTKQGIDTHQLWLHKRKMIEQTKGLRVYSGGETFDDIGGISRIKEFGSRLFEGSDAPAAIVWVDEIEKAMAGSSGSVADSSGTSQDQLGQLLVEMQNNEWPGMILPGPPGCAKSLFAKALGTSHNVPCIQLDLGAMKGSLVGQSEQQIREAMKVIKAVAGKNAYWVATCNRMESLPPELRRRFTDGIWFFDLPDQAERAAIWSIMRKKYTIDAKDKQPNDSDWTGADIRNTCSIAKRLRLPLIEAATYITPVAKSDPESIQRLRRLANERFLSASHIGTYKLTDAENARHVTHQQGREITL